MGRRIRVSAGGWILAMGGGILWVVEVLRRGMTPAELGGELRPWGAVLAAAILHELGHVVTAWGGRVGIRGIRLDLFGARMELSGLLSYGREMAVAAGGPLASLLWAAWAYPLSHGGEGVFFWANLALGVVNLLPVGTLDGGRILRCGVAWLWGERVAAGVLRVTTAVGLGSLWMLSVYGLMRGGQLLSGFVFSLCLLLRAVWGRDT